MEVIKVHPDDNVLIALTDLKKGQKVSYNKEIYHLTTDVQAKHKFATRSMNVSDPLVMYGVVIGKAVKAVNQGEVISTVNVKHDADPYVIRHSGYSWAKPDVSHFKTKKFLGYHRSDGQVGTRNYWIVVPLVFCENRNVEYLKNAFSKHLGYELPDKYEGLVEKLIRQYRANKPISLNESAHSQEDSKQARVFENIDGVKFLTHSGGCGGTREDSDNLCKLIAGYINNPNVAGATILSLGCQHAQIENLKQSLRDVNASNDKPVLYFEQQKYPSEELLLQQAIQETFVMLSRVNKISRRAASLDKLCIGLKCGGSDGFSGITANPAMGLVSDLLVALGGKTILAEFPELCGVEQNLIDRCVTEKIGSKFATLMQTYNAQAESTGSGFSMNPSPGNIKDGLITDAMKSAGAARKGGTSPVTDVLDYAQYATTTGLNLLCTPGNDVEATTGMAGSGANLIIFSTGLGTPTGNPICPIIKTSTNSILKQRITDIIDFDHGDIITEGKSIEQSGKELLEFLIRVAGGEVVTKAEQLHQDDFIPWKKGVSL